MDSSKIGAFSPGFQTNPSSMPLREQWPAIKDARGYPWGWPAITFQPPSHLSHIPQLTIVGVGDCWVKVNRARDCCIALAVRNMSSASTSIGVQHVDSNRRLIKTNLEMSPGTVWLCRCMGPMGRKHQVKYH